MQGPSTILPAAGRARVRALYAERADGHRRGVQDLSRADERVAMWRLATTGVVLVSAYFGFTGHPSDGAFSVLGILVFIALTMYHGRVAGKLDTAKRQLGFYEAGLRRIDGVWQGMGVHGDRFIDPKHPYSSDLDIFGAGSLFELLCTARTRSGEECLARMLSNPVRGDQILARQQAVADFTPRLGLREEIALLGQVMRSRVHAEGITAWGCQLLTLNSRPIRILSIVITAATVVCGITWATGLTGFWPFVASVTAGRIFERSLKHKVDAIVRPLGKTSAEFAFVQAMVARLERESFSAPLLVELHKQLVRDGKSASARLGRLTTIVGWLDARFNQLFIPLALLLLWTTHCAYAIEGWRRSNGADIGNWISTIGEFEALGALASYAFEHPDQPFPEILPDDADAVFEAEALGHPLMPPAFVTNDVAINHQQRLTIISGSNMSGKSTLMRTIGVNAVLAMAGAPVRVSSLRFQPRSIATSINTLDSLSRGVSRFYAEITRLRQIVQLSASTPTLFLIDEMLHGTNSHDRHIGAEAVLRTLVRQGAVGLVTTHDLALAAIVDDPTLAAVNAHFEDQILDGRMSFDYHLQPGVVEKSNALELMRAVGLDV